MSTRRPPRLAELVLRVLRTPRLGALAASSILSRFLFGIEPRDPVSFAGAVAVLSVAGLAASLLAAGRAVLFDPVEAIRTE